MKQTSHAGIIGFGLLAATAAGAYFLYGSAKGPARRKALRGWTVKMKGEIMEGVEKMEDVTKEMYDDLIDRIKDKYAEIKDIDPVELAATVKTLKAHWKDIQKEIKKATTKTKKKTGSRAISSPQP